MPIVPDTKDWTWVVEQSCPQCGFDASSVAPAEVGARTRTVLERWPAVLERSDVRVRPDGETWSALEYSCHVRDVFALYRFRLGLMLEQDDPIFPNWDQDATAVEVDYATQDPSIVSTELVHEGGRLAAAFDVVPDDSWGRTGRRSDGASFTVITFARYFLHDVVHHLHDVRAH